jgi:hypothetical protein
VGLKCDFCGEKSTSVTRVALDKGYNRLTVEHEIRYACSICSEKKDRKRLELDKLDPKHYRSLYLGR